MDGEDKFLYITIPNTGELVTELNIDTDIQSNKDIEGLNFLELLSAVLDRENKELDFSPQKIEKDYKRGVEISNIFLFNYIYSNPIFLPQTLFLLDKEKADILSENQKITEQIVNIVSLMKPGDEIVFNIDDKEILIRKDLQSQVSVLVDYKDVENKIKTTRVLQPIRKDSDKIQEEEKSSKIIQDIQIREDTQKTRFSAKIEEISEKFQIKDKRDEILEGITGDKVFKDIANEKILKDSDNDKKSIEQVKTINREEIVQEIVNEPKVTQKGIEVTKVLRDREPAEQVKTINREEIVQEIVNEPKVIQKGIEVTKVLRDREPVEQVKTINREEIVNEPKVTQKGIEVTKVLRDREPVEQVKTINREEIVQEIVNEPKVTQKGIEVTKVLRDREPVEQVKTINREEIVQEIGREFNVTQRGTETTKVIQDRLDILDISIKEGNLEANIKSEKVINLGNEDLFSFKRMPKNNSSTEDNSFRFTYLNTNQRDLLLSHLSSKQDIEFREEIVKLVSAKIEEKDTVKEAILKLHPDIPGEIRVKILLEGERLYIRLVVSNDNLKSFVESNLDSLKKSLIEKEFNLGGIDIYIMGNNSGNIFYGKDKNNQDLYTNLYSYRRKREILNKSEVLVDSVKEGLIDIRL